MQNDMLKLNMQLHNERGVEHELQQGSSLMENDFIGGLKVIITLLINSYTFWCLAKHFKQI